LAQHVAICGRDGQSADGLCCNMGTGLYCCVAICELSGLRICELSGLRGLCCTGCVGCVAICGLRADNMRVGLRNMRQNMRVGLCCNMPIKRQYTGCVVEHIVCCRVVCCRVKITCEPDPLSVLAFTYEQLKSSLSFFLHHQYDIKCRRICERVFHRFREPGSFGVFRDTY
jgi:hypothetical protein